MNLKEAREIARKVGATIEEKTSPNATGQGSPSGMRSGEYIVRLGVVKIGPNGTRENIVLHATSPVEAANLAVIETGRNARALADQAKKVYVDSDLIFGMARS